MIRTMSVVGVALSASLLVAAGAARRDDADQLIAARQAAFKLSGATFGNMKGVIDAKGDVTKLGFGARSLAEWAHALPGLFPAGSDGGTTKALPTVWSDRAGFLKAAATYETEARKLADLSKAGDAPGFAAQWTVVRGACKACHDVYHQPETPRG
ncbi:MAG: cytochrome c [Sphingomonas sp.]|uniref:c-type cytochrome n=1 Tax=Sphingomonas sp. TaxID=28214 RepID=UPI00122943CF|nr:cytochrome c [Sphingomonas sp.]THD37878.1 MAG: cytochrome c [Sphingomonas sp.]